MNQAMAAPPIPNRRIMKDANTTYPISSTRCRMAGLSARPTACNSEYGTYDRLYTKSPADNQRITDTPCAAYLGPSQSCNPSPANEDIASTIGKVNNKSPLIPRT